MTSLRKDEEAPDCVADDGSSLLEPETGPGCGVLLDQALIRQWQGLQAKRPRIPDRRAVVTKGAVCLLLGGLLNLVLGGLSLVWTPFSIFMNERLKMEPGFPAYEWWVVPPDVFLRVYVFNVTNGERFLEGKDNRLRLQEVGPIVFMEKLYHDNVTFNGNGTMTYTAYRKPEYVPELSAVKLEDRVVVPNMAVLGIASYLHDASSFTQFGLRMMMRRLHSHPLVHQSVEQFLWNSSDPLLDIARTLVPFLVPGTNIGVLDMIYRDFIDEVTVHMGPGSSRRFFTMDRYHGDDRFNYWKEEMCDTVKGATEGVLYHQTIMRNDSLRYFRKTLCRVAPIEYVKDLVRDGIDSYLYELPDNFFDREEDPKSDCYAGSVKSPLLSGLTDLSPCFFNFPLAASAPHFLNGDPSLVDAFDGLHPNKEDHGSYVVVEPVTGVPMESCARIQSNLVVRKLSSSIEKIGRFSDLSIPMFWAEYHQPDLPSHIYYFIYFIVNILPDLQSWLSFLFIIGGIIMMIASVSTMLSKKQQRRLSYKFLDLMPSSYASSTTS